MWVTKSVGRFDSKHGGQRCQTRASSRRVQVGSAAWLMNNHARTVSHRIRSQSNCCSAQWGHTTPQSCEEVVAGGGDVTEQPRSRRWVDADRARNRDVPTSTSVASRPLSEPPPRPRSVRWNSRRIAGARLARLGLGGGSERPQLDNCNSTLTKHQTLQNTPRRQQNIDETGHFSSTLGLYFLDFSFLLPMFFFVSFLLGLISWNELLQTCYSPVS